MRFKWSAFIEFTRIRRDGRPQGWDTLRIYLSRENV